MASFVQHLLLLLFLFLASSFQTQARESQFFSKASRDETSPKEAAALPEKTPTIQKEEPATLPPQSQNGYGLYGRGPNQFSPTTTTTTNYYYNNNNNVARRETDNIPSSFTNTELSSERYENKESNANNIPSSFTNTELSNERYENKESNANNIHSSFSNEEFSGGSYENKESNAAFPNYSSYNKQYGMSDTRFLENGKYFYDVNAEGYGNRYEPTRGNPEGYGEYNGVGTRSGSYGNGGYSYGGNKNGYEYKNGVEGYQNSQENQESQEEYVP